MVVIGGLGSIPGALLGALYVRGVSWVLPVDWQILATGAGLLVVLLVFPGGLGAAFADLRDVFLRRVARRRGIAAFGMPPAKHREPARVPTAAPRPPPDAADVPGSSDGAIVVRALDVEYDGVQVLFGVDFDAGAGEVVAVLGTNGSGKSTLLRAISGVVRPEHGTVTIDGRTTTRLPAERIAALGVSHAPGGNGVFPSLTVAEHVRLARWLRRDGSRGHDAVRRFPQLEARWGERAGNLSGGEQQLLTLSMALAARPRWLLVDELTLGLAPSTAEHVVTILRELRDAGTTVVVVEQSLDLALQLADRAYFLEQGEVRFEGSPQVLVERPDLVRAVFLTGTDRSVPHAWRGTPPGRPARGSRSVTCRSTSAG
jgi:ABC-type branched-subunit amino acid transport system ATPase component